MPSPLVHAAAGYVGHSLSTLWQDSADDRGQRQQLLLTSIIMSCLADSDVLFGIAVGNLERVHNSISHSLFFGLPVSASAGALLRVRSNVSFWRGFLSAFFFHALHLALDLLGRNRRGVPLLAPLSSRRYRIPLRVFYGVRWDQGLFSRKHLWMLATETFSVATLLAIVFRFRR